MILFALSLSQVNVMVILLVALLLMGFFYFSSSLSFLQYKEVFGRGAFKKVYPFFFCTTLSLYNGSYRIYCLYTVCVCVCVCVCVMQVRTNECVILYGFVLD
jgi:hypothetical protein